MTFTEELDDTIIEPITLEETKEYLGYAADDHKDDALLERLITASRSLLEDGLGRYLVVRSFKTITQKIDGPYHITPFVQSVDGVTYEIYDQQIHDWIIKDTMDYEYEPGDDAVVFAHFPRGARNISIYYTAGYTQIPEAIKMAMLEVVKMKYERSAIDPFSIVRPSIQKWKVENL